MSPICPSDKMTCRAEQGDCCGRVKDLGSGLDSCPIGMLAEQARCTWRAEKSRALVSASVELNRLRGGCGSRDGRENLLGRPRQIVL